MHTWGHGATPAYRGYRLQALYTLARILQSTDDEELIFQPEGQEDLAVFNADGTLSDVTQIKAYAEDLTLSSFEPAKQASFFYRIASLLQSIRDLRVTIASFGDVGPELSQALSTVGPARKKVAEKLSGHGFISEAEASSVLATTKLIAVDEAALMESVKATLNSSLTGVDPDNAFDILSFWLYICAEQKVRITRRDVISKVDSVGRFLAERSAHHREWFTSITPVEDHEIEEQVRDELAEEFYFGVSARYDHVLAGLDIVRLSRMQEVAEKFDRSRVVIIHGASGQGKTTLAYRYLHDFFPNQWRFKVQAIEDRQHALSIAAALVGHANAIGIPAIVYLDVSPSDLGWPELVKQLAAHRNMRVLATIREEDFKRATISGAETPFLSLELEFKVEEAQAIYEALTSRRVSEQFLTFEDAWSKFGGAGPLMEFVYLITQGSTLQERLAAQVKRLQDDVREGKLAKDELELLRLVSVASAFESRLEVVPLIKHLGLPEPKRTLELFEKEYLLRLINDGNVVQGLHPIRSLILSELLTDPVFAPLAAVAAACLYKVCEPDVETFLLNAFLLPRSEIEPILQSLADYRPARWVAIAGVARALLWLGIREHAEANRQLIDEAFGDLGQGWFLRLDWDISNAMPDEGSWQDRLGDLIPPEGRRRIEASRARQTDKKQVFAYVENWLSGRIDDPVEPVSDADWAGAAEAVFWAGRLGVYWPVDRWLSKDTLQKAIDQLPIEILADLMLGLSFGYRDGYAAFLDENRTRLMARFRWDTQTVVLQDDRQKLTAHFIVDFEQQTGSGLNGENARRRGDEDILSREAVRRLRLLRNLLPDREAYACQGYGHRLFSAQLPFDSTTKTGIAKAWLAPLWLTSVNSTFRGVAELPLRPRTWQEYASVVSALRRSALKGLKQLQHGLQFYFRKQQRSTLLDKEALELLTDCQKMFYRPPLLPQCALDKWGFIDESMSVSTSQEFTRNSLLLGKNAILLHVYQPFLTAFKGYVHGLSNFFNQSIEVIVLNSAFGKGAISKAPKEKVAELLSTKGIAVNSNAGHLSIINLADAARWLSSFQAEYNRLLGRFPIDDQHGGLVHQEQHFFSLVWSMWYYFVQHPNRRMPDAGGACAKEVASLRKKLKRYLVQELRSPGFASVRIEILSDDLEWEYEPAIWLTVDGQSAFDVYSAPDNIIAAIRLAVSRVEKEDNDLLQYLLGFLWRYVVIQPLVRGRALSGVAWRIFLPLLTTQNDEGEIGWWNYVPKTVPPDTWAKLGLTMWMVPRLEIGTKLVQATGELSLLAAHLSDFRSLPDPDEEGREQLMTYMQRVVGRTQEVLEAVFSSVAEIATTFSELQPAERERRPHLVRAGEAVAELHDTVLPVRDYQCQATMTLEMIGEWASRLEAGRGYAFLAYLFWVSDVLEERDSTTAVEL